MQHTNISVPGVNEPLALGCLLCSIMAAMGSLPFNEDGTKIVLFPSCMGKLRPVALQHVCGCATPCMVSLSPG